MPFPPETVRQEAMRLYSPLERHGRKPWAKLDCNQQERYLIIAEFNLGHPPAGLPLNDDDDGPDPAP